MSIKLKFCALFFTVFVAHAGHASPVTSMSDIRLRQSLQMLVDAGAINLNISTWPVYWSAVHREFLKLDRRKLTDHTLKQAYEYASYELGRNRKSSARYAAGFHLSNEAPLIKGFGDTATENHELWVNADWMGEYTAFNLKVTAVEGDYKDAPHVRLDGSFVALALGDWVFGIGKREQWWGPGWQTSLALSTNARPFTSGFITRGNDSAPEFEWLRWIGPWKLDMFGGLLEEDRVIPDAKILGMRFTFRPLQYLELGAFRTAQWGGEGRPESFSSLVDLLLGRDNVGSEGITEDNEPGNQIGGLDARLSLDPLGAPGAVYMQMAGEDEAGGFPSKRIYTFGAESNLALSDGTIFAFMEYSDTMTRRLEGREMPDVAYQHKFYRSGYRYEGRNLAASVDADSEIATLGVDWMRLSNQVYRLRLHYLNLGSDGNRKSVGPSGEFVATEAVALGFGYQNEWQRLRYQFNSTWVSEELRNDYVSVGNLIIEMKGEMRF